MVRNIIKARQTDLAKDNHSLIKVTLKEELYWNMLNLSNFYVQGKTFCYKSRALHFFAVPECALSDRITLLFSQIFSHTHQDTEPKKYFGVGKVNLLKTVCIKERTLFIFSVVIKKSALWSVQEAVDATFMFVFKQY